MIAHLHHDLYLGVLGWFCGLASELEPGSLGAVHPAHSPMAGPWCHPDNSPMAGPWCHPANSPMAGTRAQPVTGCSTSPYRCPLHTKRKSSFGALCDVGDRKWSQFMHPLRNALHLTLQARCHHCPGCHFDLKQMGFTATYRPHQCLSTSRNTIFSIFRAGLMGPHGFESCTWQNRDLIPDTMHALTHRPACIIAR
jgi:hypothetical protein